MSGPRSYSSPLRNRLREETRASLKEAALLLFSTRGYSRTQIAEIAKKAKVAPGTFYVHFDDKEALARDLLQEFNAGFLESLRRNLEGVDPEKFDDLVEKVSAAFLDYWGERRRSIKALVEHFARAGETDSLHRGFSPELVAYLSAFFSNAIENEEISNLVVHGVLGMWLRVGLRYVHENDRARSAKRATYVGALTRMTQAIVREFVNPTSKGKEG